MGGVAVVYRVVRETLTEGDRALEEERAAWVSAGKSISARGNVCAKALGQDCGWCVGGTARRTLWLEQSEREGRERERERDWRRTDPPKISQSYRPADYRTEPQKIETEETDSG